MKAKKRVLHGLIQVLILTLSTLVNAQTNPCLQIGQNVGAPNRYNGSYTMFKNIMFGSTAFTTNNPTVNNYSYLPTDENGYPNSGLPAGPITFYTHPNNMQTYTGHTIITTAMQASPQDFPWGVVSTPTDSCGIYTVFWEGSGALKLIYNRYVGGTGAGIITIPGTFGTITTSGTSYYGGDRVAGMGISAITSATVTSNNMQGLHYCQFRIPNGLNTDSRGGFDVALMVSQPAPNHLRNIAFVYPNARALGNSMGTVPSMTKILPSEPYGAFADPKHPEFFLNKPFNPMYLNWFRGFKILRFMDAMGANGIDYEYDQNWSTRRPKGYYSQSNFHDGKVGISMAYEWIIDIANEVGADPWINASTTGDENHYQQMARMFHQKLDPKLKIYLELGNEQWNFGGGFNTFFMLQNYATNNNIPYGPNGAAAVKEGQLWRAFFNEYGIDSLKCKRVCSGFPGNPDVTRGKVMYHQILKQNWDYFSMTWYFSNTGPMSGAQSTYWGGVGDITGTYNVASTTPAQYNAEMQARIGTPIGYGEFLDEILSMTNMANGYQKKVLGYEGGLGSWEAGSGRTIQDPALFAKFDPSIRDLYKVVLDTIRNHPEIEAVCQFADFGGNGSGPQNNGYYGYGTGTSIMTDTSATGNSVWPASFGSYNIYGTNKVGLWKELLAQQYKPSICEPQSVSDNTGPGNALKFNSDRFQFVDYLSSTNLNNAADFSFEIWIKPEDANKTMDILAFTNQASSSMNALRIDAANHINWIIKDASGSQALSLNGPLVENGKWYHIAVVKQGANCKLYVNGSVVAVGNSSGTYSSNRINLGASVVNSGAPANYFKGQLDELRIWNGGALAATTIQDFMCKKLKPSHPNYSSLSNYVVFNSITGNNLYDLKTGTSATNALNNFSSVSGFLFYVTSGAPIGDESLNIYPGSWTNASLTFTSPTNGDIVQISGMGAGVPDGAHLYIVNGTPTLNALPNYYTGVGQTKYFGVFMANGSNPSYNIKYYYQGNPDVSATDDYNRLIKRADNSDNAWINGGAVLDDLTKSLTINCRESYRSEYNIGVRQSSLRPKQGSGKCVSFNVGTLTGGGGKMVSFYRTDDYTISFWAVYRGPSWGNVLWFGNKMLGQSGYQGGPSNMYALYSSGGMYTRFSGVSTQGNDYAAGTGFAGGPQWNHYAITKQGSTLNLFVDGMLAGSGLDAVNYVFTELDLATAATGTDYSVEFKGEIDELSIWSQPFTIGEIRDLMCKKVTPMHPEYCNLKAYFRFDQGSGNVVENEVGGGDLVMNDVSWLTSGAALGDESVHNYNAPFSVSMTHPDGDQFKFDYLLKGSQNFGTQIYRVNEAPFYTGTIPSGIGSMDNSRYWGVFEIGKQNYQQNTYRMNYRMTYNYAANKNINLADESSLTALDRKENDAMDWIAPSTVAVDNSAKTVTVMPEAYSITGLNTTTNQFTVPNHGLKNCDIISYYYEGTALTYGGGSIVALNSTFLVKVIDGNTVELYNADPNLACTGLAATLDVGTLGTGNQFLIKTNNFKRDEIWFANTSINGFINTTAIPTIGGVNGKSKVCQAETDLTYRIKAPVDINAIQFIWTGSSGLAVGTSNTDTVLVSVISPSASIETLSVVGVNRNGRTTPTYVFTITVTGTGSHSADITGAFSSCALTINVPYSISGVTPVPLAYYWSVTGIASFAGANTSNAVALNFSENPGSVILSVYGQYACGTSLINTMTIKNSKLPNLHLPVEGGIVCSATTVLDSKITIRGTEQGVIYSAFDVTGAPSLVGSISGTGGPVQISYDRTLLTPWSTRTIQIKASNSPCSTAILDTTVTITLSNTLSGTEMANVFFNGPTVPQCFALSQINLYNITLTGTRANVTYTPYVFNYNINYPYYDFAYNLGPDVEATGNQTLLTIKPDAFDYWYSYTAPNTIGGMAMAPGCPAQRLPNVYDMKITRASGSVIASKITGYTGLRMGGDDDDPPICAANQSKFYTTAWGGSADVFLGREVFGSTNIGSPNITITSKSISLADIDIGDVLYLQESYQNSLGGGELYVVSKTANTLKVSNTLGGVVVTATSANLNFTMWAPVTIPQVTNGDQFITIPAKYVGHGLRLYSQVRLYTTSDVMVRNLPSPANCSNCTHTYFICSISGNSFVLSRLPNNWGPESSMPFHVERGTLSLTNGSTVVNGTGTRFGQDLYGAPVVQAGDIIRDEDERVIGIVASVGSATQLTLISAYTGVTRVGTKYSFQRPMPFGLNGFGTNAKSVVLSTATDAWDGSVANQNGFDWQVSPLGAALSISGVGGYFDPTSGEYINNSTNISTGINTTAGEGFFNRVKNGVTVIWNPTFAGTAYVAVRTRNQCGTTVYVNTEAYTPGYERTQIGVRVNSQIPTTPDPISFADIPLCNTGSNSVLSTAANNSSGGYQWQVLNAGTSYIPANGYCPCDYDHISQVMGAKTGTCTGVSCTANNSTPVNWDKDFGGIALVQVRSYGCDQMTASPWVMANITVTNATSIAANITGATSICAQPTSLYKITAVPLPVESSKWFLLPANTVDVYSGLVAYYTMDNLTSGADLAANVSPAPQTIGVSANMTEGGSSVIAANNALASSNSAANFGGGGGYFVTPANNGLDFSRELTLSAWVNYTDDNGSNPYIIYSKGDRYQGAPCCGQAIGAMLIGLAQGSAAGDDRKLSIYWDDMFSTLENSITTDPLNNDAYSDVGTKPYPISGVITPGVWHHVALTIKPNAFSGMDVKAYVDGLQSGSTVTFPGTTMPTVYPSDQRIGGMKNSGHNFKGLLDEVALYRRALSLTEIQALRNLNPLVISSNPAKDIGSIDVNSGLLSWVPTFTGAAKIVNVPTVCAGDGYPVYLTVTITSQPSISGVDFADPITCASDASGIVLVTLSGYNGTPGTLFSADLNGGGYGANAKTGTISGNNIITITGNMPPGYSISQLALNQPGVVCKIQPELYNIAPEHIVGGVVPPSAAVSADVFGLNPQCSSSTAIIRLSGSENGINYFAMIGSKMVSTTLLGTGSVTDLTIAGNNLTSSGADMIYPVRILAQRPGCTVVTLTGVPIITVNGTANFVYASNSYCNNFAGTVIPMITGTGGSFNSSPSGLIISNTGVITPIGSVVNSNYTIGYTISISGGCVQTTSITGFAITQPITTAQIVFAYNNSSMGSGPVFCTNSSSPSPSPNLSSFGGSYTAKDASNNNANAMVSAADGILLFDNNTVGNYTIFYTIPVTSICGAIMSQTNVTVNSAPALPVLNYGSEVYCSDTLKIETLNPQTGGRYVSSEGNINSITGTLQNLNQGAVAGIRKIYSISYINTVAGCSSPPNSTIVTVTGAPIPPVFDYSSDDANVFCNTGSANPIPALSGYVFTFTGDVSKTLSLDPSNGKINFKSSDAGIWQVTYVIPAIDACKASQGGPLITILSSVGGKATANIPDIGICEETNATLSLSGNTGDPVKWQEFSNNKWNDLDQDLNSLSLTTNTLTGGTYYYRTAVQLGSCPIAFSTPDTVYVAQYPVAGTATVEGSTSKVMICDKEQTVLTLTGFTGTVQWQSTMDSTAISWNDVSNETSSETANSRTFTTPALIGYTHKTIELREFFKAKVVNGPCAVPVYSNMIKVYKCGQALSIPNALTPNSGDQNSVWDLTELRLTSSAKVKIFNRYGTEVYSTTGEILKNNGNTWDGHNLSAGTYYYVIEDAGSKKTGAVTVIK